jgi:acetylornithine deacetylase
MENEIVSSVDKNREAYFELLQNAVKIPSLTGEEGNAQEFIADCLKNLGMAVQCWEPNMAEIFRMFPEAAQYPTHWQHDLILPYDTLPSYEELIGSGKQSVLNYKNRPNVLGRLPGKGGGKSLLINGHIDTVTVEPRSDWAQDPFGAHIDGDRLYGRGSADMKGGLIAALCAVQSLVECGAELKGELLFSSVVNEEHAGNGALSMICRGIAADAAIVCEPSGNNVFTATPGDVYWDVTVKGRPRSPGARWKGREQEGVSAIEKLPPIVEGLLNLEKEYNLKTPDPLYSDNNAFSCVIGEISGGTYATVTASKCTMRGCVYFCHGLGTVQEIMNDIKFYIQAATEKDPWFEKYPACVSFLHHRNSSKCPPEHGIIETVGEAIQAATGRLPKVGGAPYGSDMDMLINQAGIPTVILGPGSIAQAHKADEYVSIEQYISCIKALSLSMYRWCNQ